MKQGLLFLFALVFSFSLFADSSVWKVSDSKHTIYIGGTIHLLRPSDYPLPKEFDCAFEHSDYIVLETDLSALSSGRFAARMAKSMFMPEKRSVCSVLKPSTCEALYKYLDREHYPRPMFERLRPWGVMLTLTQLQLEKYGIDQNGVDAYFARKAAEQGKPQRFLETPEEQISIMTGIGEGEEDAMILQTLKEMAMIPGMMEWLTEEWRKGRTERIEAELVEAMKSESPSTYRKVLSERNERWLPKIMAMLEEGKTGFVLVGMMHLIGSDGVLEQLRRDGYAVEPLHE